VARVILNNLNIRVTSVQAGVTFVRRVLHDVERDAKQITLMGEYATGRLSTSIQSQGPTVTGTTIRGSVGTDKPYARSVHDGAKIHPIFPQGAEGVYRFGDRSRPQLKFYWRKRGQVVFYPHIPGGPTTIGQSHPGIRNGKKFLTDPLRQAARRYRMHVIVDD
jgi:hypothetical protein